MHTAQESHKTSCVHPARHAAHGSVQAVQRQSPDGDTRYGKRVQIIVALYGASAIEGDIYTVHRMIRKHRTPQICMQ